MLEDERQTRLREEGKRQVSLAKKDEHMLYSLCQVIILLVIFLVLLSFHRLEHSYSDPKLVISFWD